MAWLLLSIAGENLNQNIAISIWHNEFENCVCEMAAISSRPQCINIDV